MQVSRGFRFWVEVALGSVSALLLALTLYSHDWLERLLDFEPDGGDGSAEWALAVTFSVATVLFFVDAGRLWWRRAPA